MKKTLLSILTTIFCLQAFAQYPVSDSAHRPRETHRRRDTHAPVYINLSTGINNNAGILGAGIEVAVAKHISVEGGVGLSTWGSKVYLCGKYYLEEDFKGWAFGPGITHNTGIDQFTTNMETIYGTTEEVELHLDPQTNVFLAAYRNWRLGRGSSKLYLELGWSVALSPVSFSQTAGNPMTDKSISATKILSPGGLIVALGFSFGAGSKHSHNNMHHNDSN